MVRAAVVGVGYLGRFHAQKYKALSDSATDAVKFVGLYDASLARGAEVAKELAVQQFKTLDEVAAAVDAVTIASTTQTHFEVARFFLSKHKHVNVEKPMTVTAAEGRELVELAEKNNVQLCVGHSERFNPCFQFLREKFPKPQYLELRRHAPFRLRGSDVSVVLDLMVHDLDMVVSWADGAPVEIISVMGGKLHSETLDWAECQLQCQNQKFRVSVSRVASAMSRVVRGYQGKTAFTTDFQTCESEVIDWLSGSETPAKKENLKHDKKDHLQLETQAFLAAINGKAKPVITGLQGLRVLELALTIQDRILRA